MEDYLGYRVLDSDSSCLALYFFQSENLKESVNESTCVEVDPYGIASKKTKMLESAENVGAPSEWEEVAWQGQTQTGLGQALRGRRT